MLKVRNPRLVTVGLDMLSTQLFGLVNQESSRACYVKPGTKSGTVCLAKQAVRFGTQLCDLL